MLLMVTSRRRNRRGEFGDEEERDHRFRYQINHDGGAQREDGFDIVNFAEFRRTVLAELNRLRDEEEVATPKVGIYIHGFNNDYHDSIDEIYDLENALEERLGYRPILVGFSWPSSGRTTYYLSDREEVRDSVPAFARFLLDMNAFMTENQRDCFSTTYCIAHSMGNYLLRKGMEYMSDELGTPSGRMLFSETIMIAPDLSAKDMQIGAKGSPIGSFSRRIHIYYSRFDRALKASSAKRFGGNRLGRHGPADFDDLLGNAVAVECGRFVNPDGAANLRGRGDNDVSVHSSYRYHPRILADIIEVLGSVDRSVIDGRETILDGDVDRGNHFRLIDLS